MNTTKTPFYNSCSNCTVRTTVLRQLAITIKPKPIPFYFNCSKTCYMDPALITAAATDPEVRNAWSCGKVKTFCEFDVSWNTTLIPIIEVSPLSVLNPSNSSNLINICPYWTSSKCTFFFKTRRISIHFF